MDDYIKRGDIAKLAIEEKRFVFQMEDLLKQEIVVKTVYKDFFDFIKSIPAADVAPVRHGRLVNANSRSKTYQRRCTACGGIAYFCGIGCSYKYCPNCGARMDGGESNG